MLIITIVVVVFAHHTHYPHQPRRRRLHGHDHIDNHLGALLGTFLAALGRLMAALGLTRGNCWAAIGASKVISTRHLTKK